MPKGKPLSIDEELVICNLYTEGYSARQIARKLGLGSSTISYVINRNGVKGRIVWKLTTEQKEQVCSLYQQGYSASQLEKMYGIDNSNIIGLLSRRGITLRTRSEECRKYRCDHNVFSDYTPESNYWAGFIVADGNVYHGPNGKSNKLSFSLQAGDKAHLEKLNKFINASFPITEVKKGNHLQARLEINSKQIVNDLRLNYNIVPNKCFVVTVPDVLSMDNDYFRGLIDGDGCIYFGKGLPGITLCGNHMIVSSFKKFCEALCGCTLGKLHPASNSFHFCVQGKNSIRVIECLYKDATVYLDRKYKLAMYILDNKLSFFKSRTLVTGMRGENNSKSKLTDEQVRLVYSLKGLHTYKEIANMFNISKSSIADIMKQRTWTHITGGM